MNTSLLLKLVTGPLFALLTAGVYRAALWMLGGIPTYGHVGWGLGLSLVAGAVAWSHAFPRVDASALEVENAALRDAADQALDALCDPDTAWTAAGTDARQALRQALGHPTEPTCSECGVDMGGHSSGCTRSRVSLRSILSKEGEA